MTAYNLQKLKILGAIYILTHHKIPANWNTITDMIDGDKAITKIQLWKLKEMDYIRASYDPKTFKGCKLKYKLTAKGKRIFHALVDRYDADQTLNLRKPPSDYDYSGIVLFPGLNREHKERL